MGLVYICKLPYFCIRACYRYNVKWERIIKICSDQRQVHFKHSIMLDGAGIYIQLNVTHWF